MTKNLRFLFIAAACVFVLGCASSTFAQRVGGYRSIDKGDAGAKAAADFAVEKQAEKSGTEITLSAVEKAESQVVAGTNFRLCLEVTVGEDTETVEAVAYRNLKNEMSLTSWTKKECKPNEDN
jgi:hypothetical protein